jgi:uncharacterized protein (DUF1501 family)
MSFPHLPTALAGVTSRRAFLQAAAFGTVASMLPGFAIADADTDARLVLVILRGALDGLAAVPPYGDASYSTQRGELAITALDHKLDSTFALNPAFTHLYERYRAKELIVFHAAASPYRERSHFDGQDSLENGTASPLAVRDGWLNRLLLSLPAVHSRRSEQIAVALAQNVPLVLRGDARVSSWAPSRLPPADSDTLERIADLYSTDALLSGRLQAALSANDMAGAAMDVARDPLGQLNTIAAAAGRLLAADEGSRIAVMELNGWDTHANQGANNGQLFNRLWVLDQGLDTLRASLGPAWTKTAILVVTEFGRTVAVNGTRGTDHGTATCALLLGGAVAGGRIVTDWPGLAPSALYQARDLKPTLDLRAVFKGVLAAHLQAAQGDLDQHVFPESRAVPPLEGLIRSA